jgi:P27 family predicted phage terminase small subunit
MPTRRKSLELHALAGTKSQTKVLEPDALPPSRPEYPSDISQQAKKVFKKLCALLEARHALTAGDGELLRLYALLYDRHTRALAKLAEEGEIKMYTRLDSNGAPHEMEKPNLWLKVAETCEKNMVGCLDRLGLSPLHRSKVKPTAQPSPEQSRDPLEQELDWMPPESTTLLPAAEA